MVSVIDAVVITVLDGSMRLVSFCVCREGTASCVHSICSDARSLFMYGWLSVALACVVVSLVILIGVNKARLWSTFAAIYSTGFVMSWLFAVCILAAKFANESKRDRQLQESGQSGYQVTFMEHEYWAAHASGDQSERKTTRLMDSYYREVSLSSQDRHESILA